MRKLGHKEVKLLAQDYTAKNTYVHIYILKRSFFDFFLLINLFIFGCVGSPPLCESPLQPRQAGATPHRGARVSLVAEHRLQTRRPSSHGPRAQLLRSTRDPPRPGPEPLSPPPAGRLSTTAPPGKPDDFCNIFSFQKIAIQRTLINVYMS